MSEETYDTLPFNVWYPVTTTPFLDPEYSEAGLSLPVPAYLTDSTLRIVCYDYQNTQWRDEYTGEIVSLSQWFNLKVPNGVIVIDKQLDLFMITGNTVVK